MANPADWTADLDLLTAAARLAGARALEFFRKGPEVWWKNGGHSPVSAADFAANDILKKELLSARPNYGWLSEETDDDAGRLDCETVFVIDPIDGTRAFIAGKDVWCVSAAVVHQGRPVAGVLFAPSLGELFTAAADGPALKNDKPITTTQPDAARPTRMAVPEDMVQGLDKRLFGGVHRISHVPSLAYRLAMVADGRIDATLVKTQCARLGSGGGRPHPGAGRRRARDARRRAADLQPTGCQPRDAVRGGVVPAVRACRGFPAFCRPLTFVMEYRKPSAKIGKKTRET